MATELEKDLDTSSLEVVTLIHYVPICAIFCANKPKKTPQNPVRDLCMCSVKFSWHAGNGEFVCRLAGVTVIEQGGCRATYLPPLSMMNQLGQNGSPFYMVDHANESLILNVCMWK